MYSRDTISWYAVRIYADKTSVLKYLHAKNIEVFIPIRDGKPMLGPITFLRCTEDAILKTKADWYHQIGVYRDPERKYPQSIPDQEMENFKMVLSLRDQEFYPLDIANEEFLSGQRVRVIDGLLKGAEGVIKRIKGHRRLIVKVSGVAAVATSYVPARLLEKID